MSVIGVALASLLTCDRISIYAHDVSGRYLFDRSLYIRTELTSGFEGTLLARVLGHHLRVRGLKEAPPLRGRSLLRRASGAEPADLSIRYAGPSCMTLGSHGASCVL